MKTKNTLRIALPIILAVLMVMAMFGNFLPTPTPKQDPSVFEYSDKTQMYSSLYDMAQGEWKTSASELEIAKLAYDLAIQTEKAKKEAFCLNWFLLAQAKWSDTPSYMEDELNRLEEGMRQAKDCSF